MNPLGQQNFEDLWSVYYEGTRAPDATNELQSARKGVASESEMRTLLRDHSGKGQGVSDKRELHLRAAFDQLLEFYSRLEIALLSGWIDDVPKDVASTASFALEHPAVIAFYETHYPLLLPRLLRQRLAGDLALRSPTDGQSLEAFSRFLELNVLLERGAEPASFLRLLEDFRGPNYSLEALLAVLADPNEFMRRMSKPPQEREMLDRALAGLRVFLQFCVGRDELLLHLSDRPLLQSAFWHYHAYWFESLSERVRGGVDRVLTQFEGWTAGDQLSADGTQEEEEDGLSSSASIILMRDRMHRLTDARYGVALRAAVGTT